MSRTKIVVITNLLLACAISLACLTVSNSQEKDKKEEKVAFDQVPAAVRETANKVCGNATFTNITREKNGAAWCYEFEYAGGAIGPGSAVIAEAGQLMDLERTIDAALLPQAVRDAVQRYAHGATIASAETVEHHAYEVDVVVGTKHKHVEISATGKMSGKHGKEEDEDEGDEDEEHEKR